MMRYVFAFLFVAILFLLGACSSIVGAIIGEQPVTNLFGLDGKVIEFGLPSVSETQRSSAISPAQLDNIPINVDLGNIPINDLGDLDFPLGATPKAASEELGVNGTVTLTSAAEESEFPESLGLANPELDLTVKDGSDAPSIRIRPESPEVSVTFTKSSCEVLEGKRVCSYQAPESEVYFFTLALEGEDFQTLFNDILQAGAPTNTANGVVTLFVSATSQNTLPIPLDSSFKVILETRNGKIDFF